MSLNRIQKLLFTEYSDFEDMVLVESPFAQTTRDGHGLRQVQLGLTPTKLVLAVDVLPPANTASFYCEDFIDPEIETFELIAIYPVECVNLSIFRRRKRQSLKAHFTNNRVLYFEIGGFEKRKMFWNLWCERVKFLCPEDLESLKSETSVATSSSDSSLNLLKTKKVTWNGKQIWCKYGDRSNIDDRRHKWVDKFLFIGKSGGINPSLLEVQSSINRKCSEMKDHSESTEKSMTNKNTTNDNGISESKLFKINRFGKDIKEGCSTGLFLPVDNTIMKNELSTSASNSTDIFTLYPILSNNSDFQNSELSEYAVKVWESKSHNLSMIRNTRGRHPRKYALAPLPHFLYGFGPWILYPGEKNSVQSRRSSSLVRLRRQPQDQDMKLAISKRLLTISISCEAFNFDRNSPMGPSINKIPSSRTSVLLFWTPEYWHRPQISSFAYKEFLEHMSNLKHSLEKKKVNSKDLKAQKKKNIKTSSESIQNDLDEKEFEKMLMSATNFIKKSGHTEGKPSPDSKKETPVQKIRRLLKVEIALTAWDFDSSTFAYQLTMIDALLFNKILPSELNALIWQRCTKNTPNINTMVAFSHRISCLVATEILRDDSEKMRSQLIVRFINVADKCENIGNYHSCRSILNGLQSPAIYRLHKTWSYLRQHHAIKYHTFEKLCKLLSDPRMKTYQQTFRNVMKNPPFLPQIADLIARLLDKLPKINKFSEDILNASKCENSFQNMKIEELKQNLPTQTENTKQTTFQKFHKFLSVFKIQNNGSEVNSTSCQTENLNHVSHMSMEDAQTIIRYFDPIESDFYEDNRQEILEETTEFLDICKKAAMKYAFIKNDLANEYLLKARYREELDNFLNSFKLEPKFSDVN